MPVVRWSPSEGLCGGGRQLQRVRLLPQRLEASSQGRVRVKSLLVILRELNRVVLDVHVVDVDVRVHFHVDLHLHIEGRVIRS